MWLGTFQVSVLKIKSKLLYLAWQVASDCVLSASPGAKAQQVCILSASVPTTQHVPASGPLH